VKKKKWVVLLVLAAVVAGAAIIAAKGRDKKDIKDPAENTPFRLGKVQAEDLQVSVREVGVVDPVTKVDVKSAVSGRVIALKIREGAVVKSGDVLAEIEPDVNQAQSLSDVQASVKDAELKLQDAERDYAMQKALFEQGLVGRDAYRSSEIRRDQARETVRAAQMRYQIVADRANSLRSTFRDNLAQIVITERTRIADADQYSHEYADEYTTQHADEYGVGLSL